MTEQYIWKDQLLLGKIEAAAGTEESLDPAADAALVGNLRFAPNFQQDDGSSEHGSSLDAGEPIVLGGGVGVSFDARMKGSGAQGTPPEWGKYLRACGCAETVTAAPVADTSQAGGANTITLHAGASATDDAYKGMPIVQQGERNLIVAYDGATKIATVARDWDTPPTTTPFTIPANVLYRLASLDLAAMTLHGYLNANQAAVDSRRRRAVGARGNMSLRLGPRQLPIMSFQFTGILPGLPDNAARPTGVALQATQAPAFRGATALIDGSPVKFTDFSLDFGGQVQQPDDPAQEYGMDVAAITARRVNGSITPYTKLNSTRDFYADWQNEVAREIAFWWGKTDGNRLALLLPAVRYTGNDEGNANGLATEGVTFQSTGFDDAFWLCVF
ncbi:MAG: hypothetical protein Kow00114_36000 [Kiloniellaceae bacterium]